MTGRGWLVWLVGFVDWLARIFPHGDGPAGRRLGEWG